MTNMKILFIISVLFVVTSCSPQGSFWWQQNKKETVTESKIVTSENKEPRCDPPYSCVMYYNCTDPGIDGSGTGGGNTDGAGIINIRYGNQIDRVCKDNVLHVCCKNPGIPDVYTTEKPIPQRPHKCGAPFYNDQKPNIDIRVHLNKSIHGFDNNAQFGAYPWTVALLYDDNGYEKYVCGGALIHRRIVLTAAHCLFKIPTHRRGFVRLGEYDSGNLQDHPDYKHQDIDIEDYVIHEGYNDAARDLHDDVAVIKLQKRAKLDYHIDTVCLPPPKSAAGFVGTTCYVAGWGTENFGNLNSWGSILKEVDLDVVDRQSCQTTFKNHPRLGCGFCLHDTFLCAGGVAGKDTCTGDGGAPLVCEDAHSNAYVALGLVAWGLGCGDPIPAAYVDVSKYVGWIEDKIKYFVPKYKLTYPGAETYNPSLTEAQRNPEYKYCYDNRRQACYG